MTLTPLAFASLTSATEVFVLTWQMCIGTLYAAASAISLAVPVSSAAAGIPLTPSFWLTSPSFIFPPSAKYKSSQWATTHILFFGAFIIACAIYFVFSTGLPSSDRAITPAFERASISVGSILLSPLVTAAAIYTLALAFAALFLIYSTTSVLSTTGFVLGIASRLVTPPAAAALHPVIMSSFSVKPGSRKCTCISTSPGAAAIPSASISTSAL